MRRGRPLRRVGEHAGLLIALAAAGAFVLGIVGLRSFVPGRSWTDYVYRSLQLFVVYVEHSGVPTDRHVPTPLTLDIARFLAPAAAAAASIRALLALFGQKAARTWVRYFVRDHVVVCGVGSIGARLAIAFHDAGYRVVAIERNTADAAVHDCREQGVIVLVGDATDRDLLVRAGLLRARYLVVASGEDGTNADVALAARDVAARRRVALPSFVHVVHPGLSGLLGEATLGAGGGGPLRLEFFNPWESVPPMVLDEFPPEGRAADGTVPHMLVVGPGRLGRALVTHAARRRATEAAAAGRRMEVTLVGEGASEAARDLGGRYPRMEHVCQLRAVELDVESAAFEQAAYLAGHEVTSAYVTMDDDASGLRAALALGRVLPHVRVVVLATQHAGLAALVSGVHRSSSSIAVFDVLARSCRPEILLNGTIELLARAFHRNYVRTHASSADSADEAPGLREWEDLPEALKEANRAQAADVGTKLAAVGCRIQPWTDWTGDGMRFGAEEIERMAEIEHERWCRDRTANGWTYGPTRDDRRKTSPYLVAWDELTEAVKDYDRDAVRALPELLTYAGYEIVPR